MTIYEKMRAGHAPKCIVLTLGNFYDNRMFEKGKTLISQIVYADHARCIIHLLDMAMIADALQSSALQVEYLQ